MLSRSRIALLGFLVLSACAVPGPRPSDLLALQLSPLRCEPGHAVRCWVQVARSGLQVQVRSLGQDLRLTPLLSSPNTFEGFLAVPLDRKPGYVSVTVTVSAGGEAFTLMPTLRIVPRSPFAVSRVTIASMERLDYGSESRTMTQARQLATERTGLISGDLPLPFEWPFTGGRISENFGNQRIYNHGRASWYHGGLDIAAPEGTSIAAVADGTVILVRPFEAHGNTILLDHGFGVVTSYLHQARTLVQEGDAVKRGQTIGWVGSTGGSTGPHLHFQVNLNGIMVDPRDFLGTDRHFGSE